MKAWSYSRHISTSVSMKSSAFTPFTAFALGAHFSQSLDRPGSIDTAPGVGHEAQLIISTPTSPAPATALEGQVGGLGILRGKVLKELGEKLPAQEGIVLLAHLLDGGGHVLGGDRAA